MDMLPLALPLTGMPVLVHHNGAIGPSSFPAATAYRNRNDFWVLNLMGGTGEMEIDGAVLRFSAGCAVLTPPRLTHTYRLARPMPFVHAHFRASGEAAPMPMVQDLGLRAPWAEETLRAAARRLLAEPERATVALWNLLWEIAGGPARSDEAVHHPIVRQLLAHVAERLAEPLDPVLLAHRLGTSQRHLNRLCVDAFGLPLARWVRRERLHRAQQLLAETDREVADIARAVGFADLQHFNKRMRAFAGRSPRKLR